jgi:uncharacterized RDD family membrane protein YckC
MAAAILDALVVLAILLIGYGLLAGLAFMVDPLGFTFPRVSWLFNLTVALAVTVAYLMAGWTISGRTYGKLVMGLRVRGPDDRRLRPVGALVRALACVLFPIGLLWSAVSATNRSVQDILLRTKVIYDWRSDPERLTPDE